MALITCVECKNTVSDLAAFCPHCGYPINSQPITNKSHNKPNRPHKYHRLPNGYGSIKKLTGKRRRPYVAYPPVKDYLDSGSAVKRNALGYFETYQEAMDCLVEFNKNPYDVDEINATFKKVYDAMYAEKYNDPKKSYSRSSQKGYEQGIKHCKPLWDRKIREIKSEEMQSILDNCDKKHATIENVKRVMTHTFRFALKKDIINKDYSKFIQIKQPDDDESGVPFTEEEIKTLWENVADDNVKVVLFMIYTGVRVSELNTMTFHDTYMIGGLKTEAGKQRIIPYCEFIKEFLPLIQSIDLRGNYIREEIFHPTMRKYGMTMSSKNTTHTPHDARHTFGWLCDKYKVDKLSKKKMIGHTFDEDIDESVYGHRTLEELISEINKIKMPKTAK